MLTGYFVVSLVRKPSTDPRRRSRRHCRTNLGHVLRFETWVDWPFPSLMLLEDGS